MTTSELKKIYQILKKAYLALDEQAQKEGVDFTSPQYDALKDKVRANILAKWGFTYEQYQQADQENKTSKSTIQDSIIKDGAVSIPQVVKHIQDLHSRIDGVSASIPVPPSQDEIAAIAHSVAQQYIKPPQITNQIVKEITKPTIIKETVKETVNVPFNPEPIHSKLSDLQNQILDTRKAIPEIPLPPDLEKFRKEVMEQQGVNLAKSINILGMPDFRKLAMGLRGDIDAISTKISKGTSAFPPMTTAQRLALSPSDGQTAFDTDIQSPYIYFGGTWYVLQLST